MQRHVGLDAVENHFIQCDPHTRDRHFAVFAVGDDLADHGIVIGRHTVAVVDMRFGADSRPAGGVEAFDQPW